MGMHLVCLREMRRERSLTQRELAQRSGLSMSTISKLEMGSGVASIRMIHKLAHGLGMSPMELLRKANEYEETADAEP